MCLNELYVGIVLVLVLVLVGIVGTCGGTRREDSKRASSTLRLMKTWMRKVLKLSRSSPRIDTSKGVCIFILARLKTHSDNVIRSFSKTTRSLLASATRKYIPRLLF
jgi:hypothetical protein